jgi:hypothetical protein
MRKNGATGSFTHHHIEQETEGNLIRNLFSEPVFEIVKKHLYRNALHLKTGSAVWYRYLCTQIYPDQK